jgi:hypothetical protein
MTYIRRLESRIDLDKKANKLANALSNLSNLSK